MLAIALFIILALSEFLPIYTVWITIFLVLPSVFFLFRREEKLDEKRLLVVLLLSLFVGVIWDTIATRLNIWSFPLESVSGSVLGLPVEEYVFYVGFPVVVLGIYTSLPPLRKRVLRKPRFNETPLLISTFLGQLLLLLWIFFTGPISFLKWLLLFAGLPSFFYIWRRGERIDELRLLATVALMLIFSMTMFYILIDGEGWLYEHQALSGRIGIIPIDEILFVTLVSIGIVGLYTSLPQHRFLAGRWK